ncbi:hypothetical protein [Paenisporosarcina quisquiliarum]|uniref:hypothetical protein n=1 Tax=Paenisporosarcina quisquiliarum TaxID=365346 RepID=UPI003734C246
MIKKFDVRLDKDAAKEYENLEGSGLRMVNKAIDELEFRADEVGKVLGNTKIGRLHGCKEIKLREAGIRIIFRISNQIVDVLSVVYVLSIEKRNRELVFKIAARRLKEFKKIEKSHTLNIKSRKWNNTNN